MTTTLSPPSSMTEDEIKAWNRILAQRKEDCRLLERQTVVNFVDDPLFRKDPPSAITDPHEKLEYILRCLLYGSMNDMLSPTERRKEYTSLKMLLKRINGAVSQKLMQQPNSATPNNHLAASNNNENGGSISRKDKNHTRNSRSTEEHNISSSSNIASSRGKATSSISQARKHSQGSLNTNQQINYSNEGTRNSTNRSENQHKENSINSLNSSNNGRKNLIANASSSTSSISTRQSFDKSTTRLSGSDVAQQSVRTEEFEVKPQPLVVPNIKTALQPVKSTRHERWFPEDSQKYSAALEKRQAARITWKNSILTQEEIKNATERFFKWDPYWEMHEILALTKTTEIEKVQYAKAEVKQAVEVNAAIPLKYQRAIQNWGMPTQSYLPGSIRLLLRMIPCKPPGGKKKGLKKKARADYHLWPKGTLLLVDDKLTHIQQRKQQAHDASEWKSLCKTLDLVNHIKTAGNNKVSAAILDPDPYFVCVAACEYHSPAQLYKSLTNRHIQSLRKDQSIRLAINHAKKNTTVCLDDADDQNDDNQTSFIFKLTCSISACLMKTPVRAPQCNHFQCFDLQNFLDSNVFVSGTRWECPVCNNELISVYDLQYCGLTAHMLDQYKDKATTFRDRIQFFSDGSWKLMGETRKRYASKESNKNDAKKQRPQEILIID